MKENKSDSKINWWVIIAVAIVVAVISSLITVSVTGNVIKQNNYIYGKYQLYTKQEVDTLLVSRLNNATVRVITSADRSNIYGSMTCQQLCKTTKTNKGTIRDITNQECLYGVGYENNFVKTLDHDMCNNLIRISLDRFGQQIACVCS